MFEVVVTRHAALLEFLKELGKVYGEFVTPDVEVLTHASEDDVLGKKVLGVLPHRLSCLAESYGEITLEIPKEKRGVELSLEDLKKFFKGVQVYRNELTHSLNMEPFDWREKCQ